MPVPYWDSMVELIVTGLLAMDSSAGAYNRSLAEVVRWDREGQNQLGRTPFAVVRWLGNVSEDVGEGGSLNENPEFQIDLVFREDDASGVLTDKFYAEWSHDIQKALRAQFPKDTVGEHIVRVTETPFDQIEDAERDDGIRFSVILRYESDYVDPAVNL